MIATTGAGTCGLQTIVCSYIDIYTFTSLTSKIFQVEGKKNNSFDMKSISIV